MEGGRGEVPSPLDLDFRYLDRKKETLDARTLLTGGSADFVLVPGAGASKVRLLVKTTLSALIDVLKGWKGAIFEMFAAGMLFIFGTKGCWS